MPRFIISAIATFGFILSPAFAGEPETDQVCTETREVEVPCKTVKPEISIDKVMEMAQSAHALAEKAQKTAARAAQTPNLTDRVVVLERAKKDHEAALEVLRLAQDSLGDRVSGTEEQIAALTGMVYTIQNDLSDVRKDIADLDKRLGAVENRMDDFSGMMTIESGFGGTFGRPVSHVVDGTELFVPVRFGLGVENKLGGVQVVGGFVKLLDDSHRAEIGIQPHLRLGKYIILSGMIGGQFGDYGMAYGRQLDAKIGGSTGYLRGLTTGGSVEGVLYDSQNFRLGLGARADVYGLGSDWSVHGERMGIRADLGGFLRVTPKIAL